MNNEPDTDESEEMPERPRAKRKVMIERAYQPRPEPKKEVEQAEKKEEPEITWSTRPDYPTVFMGSFAALQRYLRRVR